ncbi:hypothetical protein A3D23_03555 [candidate division WOR-1 bacterium RIFCSPHIGHO2_02_FULL_53_26]|nr:MAG: hypothetical protein A3D23_03555 [candidate division WOR-1 bacterium RIFCSPHIGHO2_02_FULL_53_26]
MIGLSILLAMAVWGVGERPAVYKNISVSGLHKLLQNNEDVFILDTHIPEQQHIKGTDAFIPYNEIDRNIDRFPKDKQAKIIVYCRTGRMSEAAAKKLVELGYTNVNNLSGGTVEWQKTGHDFEK